MLRFISYCALVFGALLMASCEMDREVEGLEMPGDGERITVHAYLGKDDTLMRAHIAGSMPGTIGVWAPITDRTGRQESRYRILENAKVTFRDIDTKGQVQMTASKELERYICAKDAVPLTPGHTYELTVEAEGFPTAVARATMPPKEEIYFKTSQPDGVEGLTHVEIHVPRSPRRYFMLWGLLKRTVPIYGGGAEYTILTSAESVDGVLRMKVFERRPNMAYRYQVIGYDPWEEIRLYEINEDLYLYLTTSHEQHSVNDIDRVFAPPVAVHTNVTNGYGVLGFMTHQATSTVEL